MVTVYVLETRATIRRKLRFVKGTNETVLMFVSLKYICSAVFGILLQPNAPVHRLPSRKYVGGLFYRTSSSQRGRYYCKAFVVVFTTKDWHASPTGRECSTNHARYSRFAIIILYLPRSRTRYRIMLIKHVYKL